ncbi:unnamed protein product [Arctogadus glacialis]
MSKQLLKQIEHPHPGTHLWIHQRGCQAAVTLPRSKRTWFPKDTGGRCAPLSLVYDGEGSQVCLACHCGAVQG